MAANPEAVGRMLLLKDRKDSSRRRIRGLQTGTPFEVDTLCHLRPGNFPNKLVPKRDVPSAFGKAGRSSNTMVRPSRFVAMQTRRRPQENCEKNEKKKRRGEVCREKPVRRAYVRSVWWEKTDGPQETIRNRLSDRRSEKFPSKPDIDRSSSLVSRFGFSAFPLPR